jgi:hypothetical protein
MRKKLLKGKGQDVINANIKMLKDAGYSHAKATRCALCHANKKHDKHVESINKKITKPAPMFAGGTPSDPTDSGYDDV